MSQVFDPMPDSTEPPPHAEHRAPVVRTILETGRTGGSRVVRNTVIALALAGIAALVIRSVRSKDATKDGAAGMKQFPVSVIAGTVVQKDVPIFLDGLGTVQALNTVTVRARVEGELKSLAFTEGHDVTEGEVLAQIDDAPFVAQRDQAVAKKGQDEAQLANARLDLQRYAEMVERKVIAPQQHDTQKALVAQLEAAVKADEAAIKNAQVQLDYATVRAPIAGRTGIRLVDQGNVVRATDPRGIVVITQLQPIALVFTLPAQALSEIQKAGGTGPDAAELAVLAVDRDNSTVVDSGTLKVIDNQIDTTTGTIALKANFPNRDLRLWPGQFVNARLRLTVRKQGLVVPASTIQRGPNGAYAYVIKDDMGTEMRPVKVARIEQGEALLDEGLQAGERVVVDGQYKLQPGSKVKIGDAPGKGGVREGKDPKGEKDGKRGPAKK
jgi:multidrug efflux system membrane fusion protein